MARRGGPQAETMSNTTRKTDIRVVNRNWEPRPGGGGWLVPGRRGAVPGPSIVLDPPVAGRFRIHLTIRVEAMDVLRLRCRTRGPAGARWRDVFVDVVKPGALLHDLDRVVLSTATGPGRFDLVLEGALDEGETLQAISLDASDDWFADAEEWPGLALAIDRVELLPVDAGAAERRVPHVAVRHPDDPIPDKKRRGSRDAVVFAWWVPDTPEARKVGEYYLGLLCYHHPDSRIFLGVNHGSHPEPVAAVLASGLDVQVCPVPPEIEVTSDAGGFLAALEGFDQADEAFDLVWFGHTKGASRADDRIYHHVRFQLERRFWARRAEIEAVFADPRIGLFAPQFNLPPTYPWPGPWRGWLDELAALQRIYRDRYPPLGLNALDTFFVLRGKIVRAFCDAVAPWFFRTDPADYGASRWFFEMAFPSIATMQGYEPFIDLDVPGANDPRDDILLETDLRQRHRLAQEELDRWRADPFAFAPRTLPWNRDAWQQQT
jgi:hypothetical protein